MIRFSLMSIMLASSTLLANPSINAVRDDYDSAEAYHVASGKVSHDGDYVEFDVAFSASCYVNRDEAWNNLTSNVAAFVEWFNQAHAAGYRGDLNYVAYPVSVWHQDNSIYDSTGCGGTYQVQQNIKITLNKPAEYTALNADVIQNFYNDLQVAVAPYNNRSITQPSYTSSSIANVQKGLYDDTLDALRIAAKNLAREKATKEFLATVGGDFAGDWYLISADYRGYISGDSYLPGPGSAAYPIAPTILDLGPIDVVASGTFHFVYDLK